MYTGPIAPGTGSSLHGKKPSLRSSEETQFLYLVLKSIQNLSGVIANASALGPATVAFTVDDGTAAPSSAGTADSWTITTLNVVNKNPTFLKNGELLIINTDYDWNPAIAKFGLLTGIFIAGDVYTVVY